MTIDDVIKIGQQAIFATLLIVSPILIASFVVGILMSFLQAIFQIHEYTFSFVPKLLAIFFAAILYGPWMLGEIVRLSNTFLGGGYTFVQ